MNDNQELFEFIKHSPSCFHAIDHVATTLKESGFQCLEETEIWQLEPGGKYYLISNTSSIMAFVMPEKKAKGFHVIASHSDAPTFKLKAQPENKHGCGYTTLSVEKYGGPLLAPWFDRPLSIAGRVVIKEEGQLREELIDFGKDYVSLVNLAIHMNPGVNEGYSYKMSKDIRPIWAGPSSHKEFMEEVSKLAGVQATDILDMDLYLYNRMDGSIWGANDEFISASKLDDLQCAFASVKSLLRGTSSEFINVMAIFDNEEVGSGSRQGAKSTFLSSVLRRISGGRSEEEYARLVANSFLLSADNAHALHPNYPEKSDGNHPVYLNGGVVIKYTASQRYTTDAMSGAFVKLLCEEVGVKYQQYYNHADVAGGSTLGNLAVCQVPMMAADIGAPQLAMHSPYETTGARDTESLIKLMTGFYNR